MCKGERYHLLNPSQLYWQQFTVFPNVLAHTAYNISSHLPNFDKKILIFLVKCYNSQKLICFCLLNITNDCISFSTFRNVLFNSF